MQKVAYLEIDDFDKNGNLVNPSIPKDKPAVVLVQATWCGYCKQAKPAFEQFASLYGDQVFCATIEADGQRDSEKQAGKMVSALGWAQGFPTYLLFVNGQRVDKEITGRDVESLKKFAQV